MPTYHPVNDFFSHRRAFITGPIAHIGNEFEIIIHDNTLKVKSDIQLFNQSSEAIGGIHIVQSTTENAGEIINQKGIHRDDYFIFFVLTSGNIIMQCDIVDIEMNATSICFVKPFQVHSPKRISPNATGYFISVAPFLIPNSCMHVFQALDIAAQGKRIENALKKDLVNHISLLHNSFIKPQLNKAKIINGLFNSLVYKYANLFRPAEKIIPEHKNQSAVITYNFKRIITSNNFLESPSFFASELHISTSHLNDCVHLNTGKSVTYWLQDAMIVEAKRLLYYTDNNVKEIANNLGFEDHSYFSRLFKKICNETPLAFRKKFRE